MIDLLDPRLRPLLADLPTRSIAQTSVWTRYIGAWPSLPTTTIKLS
jgi:hypothetical protein